VRPRRGRLDGLPRWAREPMASDFATEERLRAEIAAGSLAGPSRAQARYWRALELALGSEAAAWTVIREDRFPRFPDGWHPGIAAEMGAYVRLPGGPPAALAAEVERWQDEDDLALAATAAKNGCRGFDPVTRGVRADWAPDSEAPRQP
jgi:hypothetical protein